MYSGVVIGENLTSDRIFNLDETGLNTDPTKKKVLVRKDSSNAYMRTPTCGKASYSVLFCGSAAGDILPPFVVYKAKGTLFDSWTVGGPEGAQYGNLFSSTLNLGANTNILALIARYFVITLYVCIYPSIVLIQELLLRSGWKDSYLKNG